MLIFNLLLAALAVAKEVPSPIRSFSLTPKSAPGAHLGSVSNIWVLDLGFLTQTSEDYIVTGDHFTFTVDNSLYFGGKEIAFNVLDDQTGETLFSVVSDGENTFTATYTEVATQYGYVKGNFYIESYINTDSLGKKNGLTVSVGNNLFENIQFNDFDFTKPFKIGKRIGNEIQWAIRYPYGPYNRIEGTDITSKGQLFPKLQYLQKDFTLGFFDTLNALKQLTNTDSLQYTSYVHKLEDNTFDVVFSNIPNDAALFYQFKAQIISKEPQYCNTFNLEVFQKAGKSGGTTGVKSTLQSCLEGGRGDLGCLGGNGKGTGEGVPEDCNFHVQE